MGAFKRYEDEDDAYDDVRQRKLDEETARRMRVKEVIRRRLRELLVIACFVLLYGLAGNSDYEAEQVTVEAVTRADEEHAQKVAADAIFETPQQLKSLSYPLECARWFAQWGPGEKPEPRCIKFATEGKQ